MGLRLAISRIYLPGAVRRSKLNELFLAAADAFRCAPLEMDAASLDRCLRDFALFTARNAEASIKYGEGQEVRERLYCNAYRIGENIKEELDIDSLKEVMEACEVVYRALKIDFHGDSQGQVRIGKCYFSSFYTGEVCRVISGLDEGLVAGLSGGLRLEFAGRITEGNKCCEARLLSPGGML